MKIIENPKFQKAVGNSILGWWLCSMVFLFFFVPIIVFTYLMFENNVYEIIMFVSIPTCIITAIVLILLDKKKSTKVNKSGHKKRIL